MYLRRKKTKQLAIPAFQKHLQIEGSKRQQIHDYELNSKDFERQQQWC